MRGSIVALLACTAASARGLRPEHGLYGLLKRQNEPPADQQNAALQANDGLRVSNVTSGQHDPCRIVSADFAMTNITTLDRARDCLQNVPFNLTRATTLARLARNLGEFESLKDYALHSTHPEVNTIHLDFDSEMRRIADSVNSSSYGNDFDFNMDLAVLYSRFHNGHTEFTADCATPFAYMLGLPLVSLAKDHRSDPEIYVFEHLDTYFADTSNSVRLSYASSGIDVMQYAGRRVTKIQERPAVDYLQALADEPTVGYLGYQSPDARFNQLMTNFAFDPARLGYGKFAIRRYTPNATESTVLMEFDDGATVIMPFMAVNVEKLRFNSTETFFEESCVLHPRTHHHHMNVTIPEFNITAPAVNGTIGTNMTTPTAQNATVVLDARAEARSRALRLFGGRSLMLESARLSKHARSDGFDRLYADPRASKRGHELVNINATEVMSVGDNSLTFYQMDNPAVGVVQVATFEDGKEADANVEEYILNFSRAMRQGLSTFKDLGVRKVILDLTGNGGGFIGLGYIFLLHFYPSHFPGFASENRVPAFLKDVALPAIMKGNFSDSQWYYMNWTTPAGVAEPNEGFQTNATAKLLANGRMAPISDAYYTNLTDFEGELQLPSSAGDFVFRDHVPYAPTDLAMVTNSLCASTCAQVTNTLLHFWNISAVAYGGRPSHKVRRTQITGGVKGSQVFDLEGFAQEFGRLSEEVRNDDRVVFNAPIPGSFRVNLRNALSVGSQRKYEINEYADSKAHHILTYTRENYLSPVKQWQEVAEVVWGIDASKVPDVSQLNATGSDNGTNAAAAPGAAVKPARKFEGQAENFRVTPVNRMAFYTGVFPVPLELNKTLTVLQTNVTFGDVGVKPYWDKVVNRVGPEAGVGKAKGSGRGGAGAGAKHDRRAESSASTTAGKVNVGPDFYGPPTRQSG